jgi:hypothetical protein
MSNYLKVMRYSKDGFKPQVQSHHLQEYVWPEIKGEFHENPNNIKNKVIINESYKNRIMDYHNRIRKFYQTHYNDLSVGIWVFKMNSMSMESIEHLSDNDMHKWIAELPEDIEVYDNDWKEVVTLRQGLQNPHGCYIPRRCLKDLRNIKELY